MFMFKPGPEDVGLWYEADIDKTETNRMTTSLDYYKYIELAISSI